jgi:PGF-pre-PGF domain-containing protein
MKRIFAVFGLLLILFPSITSGADIGLIRDSAWSDNITGLFHSSLVLGDIDNDSRVDIISAGCSAGGVDTCSAADKMKVYINNGTSFVENGSWGQNLTNMGYGSLALGDIDNDGDLDLASLGDRGGGIGLVKIYVNNDTSFNEYPIWGQSMSAVDAYAGSIVFADIDNDGRVDITLAGSYPSSDNGIYFNNGTSFVLNSSWLNLPYVGHGYGMGAISVGDIDNDYKLDLVFAGSRSTNFYDYVFLNNGTAFQENSVWRGDFRMLGWPSTILGDYDNDGDLDLAYMGTHGSDRLHTYINDGIKFVEEPLVYGYFDGSIAWGDYDNDGDLDLAAMGKENGRNRVFNNDNGTFSENVAGKDLKDDDMQQGSLAWSDVDNNGKLDLVCIGYKYGNGNIAKVYISNSTVSNTIPNPPNSGFYAHYENEFNLFWSKGSDTETPVMGLYYNLRVGTCHECNDVVSGVYGGSSNPTAGYFGNMMQRRSITLNRHFEPGTTIYWAVQTIDTGLAKSAWSTEQVYVIPAAGNVSNCTPSWSCSSWGACQSGGTQACGSWVDANGCNGTYGGSNTQSCTYHEPGSPGGGSSNPSGGAAIESHTFNFIRAGTPATKEVSEGISVTISVRKTVANVDLAARETKKRPSQIAENASGAIYGYIEINASGIDESSIEEAQIGFRVDSGWIENEGIDQETVKLQRYHDGSWESLETALETSDGDYHYYTAKTPGFSYFAITGEEMVEGAAESPPAGGNESAGEVNTSGEAGDGQQPEGPPFMLIAAVAAIAVLAAAAAVLYLKKPKKPKTLDEALSGMPT